MIKLSSIKSFLFLLILLIFFGGIKLSAQTLDHQLGVLLVQLKESDKVEMIINSTQYFQGKRTDIEVVKLVSAPFHIWSLRFNHNEINEFDFLASIRQHPLIENAQFDFLHTERIAPDDTFYFFQYYFQNFGQNGGTPGVDLDAEIAWETSTGGVTVNGDTIVVCIIDEGFDIAHVDLNANQWINHDEVPNDSIDNDENGYTDDYYGWNVVYLNDDVSNNNNPGNHGTQVAGIAGAVGNNNLGISGINWNVKLMYVTRGYTTSDAIAAYTYPFLLRQKYNDSNGIEGAFVVATNSSWGVNYGTPDDAPLWCAIYDSLGSVGLLSAAATANLDIDVDIEGDLPTTCPSDFLVTTTKVDHNDALPPNAGYGLLNIDLAAFGKDVFTTKINNEYGNLSGTSAAAPQVAGTIALLYSAPCPSFMALAKSQPEAASLLVKEYILNGTEANGNLENITVTGGRLNVANSLQLLMDDCNYSGCYPPYSIEIEGITEESTTIDWLIGVTTTSVNVRYRVIGDLSWININNVTNPLEFTSLIPCTNYELQLSSQCGTLTSDYSLSYEFQTAGCCNSPATFNASLVEENQILLEWNEVVSASSYNIKYREVNTGSWNIFSVNDLEVTIPDLISCTSYEFQIRSQCASGQISNYSESLIVTTLGCSNCTELPYCQAAANNMSFIWIKGVSISNLDFISGNSSDGYSDHTDQSAELIQGQNYEIKLQSESDLDSLPGIFNVWIDFDQNGSFNDFDELILHSSTPEICSDKIIYVPTNALLGSTRMRISFLEQNYGSCGTSNYIGEIEDYCVSIEESTDCLPPVAMSYISHENSVEISWLGNLFNESYLIKYKEVVDTVWSYLYCPDSQIEINDLYECTDYEFVIHSVCNGEPSAPTEYFYFTTKGCGACLDHDYCLINSADVTFEWIERIQISTLDNLSGPNNGFAYFPDHSTNLIIGNPYPLVITPGFSNSQYPEYEYYMVWIDLDHDGIFSSNEIIYDSNYALMGKAETIIFIPDTALLGSTRMRVVMKYQSPPNNSCSNGFYGEIEEYCINIVADENQICNKPENLEVDSITLTSALIKWQEIDNAVSYTFRFQKADTTNAWKYITTNNNRIQLYQLDSCTAYQFQVRTNCEQGLSNFSNLVEFETCSISTSNVEQQDFISIHLYPNPSQSKFFIDYYSEASREAQFELYDLTGKLLINKKVSSSMGEQKIKIDFPEGCADGIYYLKAKINDGPPSIHKVLKTN